MRLRKSPLMENHCDIVHLVRCIQKMEGQECCFARDFHRCLRVDACQWAEYCSQLSQDADEGDK